MEQQTMRQIEDGEFAPYREEAAQMTPQAFAKKHGSSIGTWGHPALYWSVQVGGVNYLWRISTGKYDGWDWCATCQSSTGIKLQVVADMRRAIDTMRVFVRHWRFAGLSRAWLVAKRYWSDWY